MIQKVRSLIVLLERMSDLYGRIAEILDREKLALISFNFEEVMSVAREKDEALSVLKSLDEDRLRIQDQFSLIMVRSADEVTLGFVARELREQLPLEAKRLSELRGELQEKLERVRSRVRVNRIFTEKSIENLQKIASHLNAALRGKVGKTEKKVRTYTGRAQVKESAEQTGKLVEKRL